MVRLNARPRGLYHRLVVGLVAVFSLGVTVAQGASLDSIPPGVINQIKSMPPAQQRALAKQYGIDLGALAGPGAGATGPAPGQEGRNSPRPTARLRRRWAAY